MDNGYSQWNINTVPQIFWDRIENAGRDATVFKESLMDFTESELHELFAQYRGLSVSLVTEGFDRFSEEAKEELVETLEEIANWVITQGRAFYEEVLIHPEMFPTREDIRRPIFAGAIIEVYTKKFGPWRANFS